MQISSSAYITTYPALGKEWTSCSIHTPLGWRLVSPVKYGTLYLVGQVSVRVTSRKVKNVIMLRILKLYISFNVFILVSAD